MMSCGFARALLVLLLFLAAASVAESYICRYNCSNVNNVYCKTKNMVCPYPNGDDLAMERANMLLAKSTKKKCTRAMKLFICHLWFPTCEKSGAVGNVNPVKHIKFVCLQSISASAALTIENIVALSSHVLSFTLDAQVCWQECMNGCARLQLPVCSCQLRFGCTDDGCRYQNCAYSYEQAMQKCTTFTYTQQVAPEDYALP
jgi:hypothetical protein